MDREPSEEEKAERVPNTGLATATSCFLLLLAGIFLALGVLWLIMRFGFGDGDGSRLY